MKVIYTQQQKDLMLKSKLAYSVSYDLADYMDEYTLEEIKKIAIAKMKRVFKKHTKEKCEKAYYLNVENGEGGCMISESCGVHINSVDSMLNAIEIRDALEK